MTDHDGDVSLQELLERAVGGPSPEVKALEERVGELEELVYALTNSDPAAPEADDFDEDFEAGAAEVEQFEEEPAELEDPSGMDFDVPDDAPADAPGELVGAGAEGKSDDDYEMSPELAELVADIDTKAAAGEPLEEKGDAPADDLAALIERRKALEA